ncbi:Uncharacterised protein [Mycobacterium tuberculosis]|nr:Uncharacterised protein [Mycobacterium tuberculosis]COZ60771.1 Uncharacterised protein [Mycobacterium tuberculosis]
MSFIIMKNPPMATIAIHAPARNFVTSTMSRTVPVDTKPTVLTARERSIARRARGSVSALSNRVQCRTMPT